VTDDDQFILYHELAANEKKKTIRVNSLVSADWLQNYSQALYQETSKITHSNTLKQLANKEKIDTIRSRT